MSQTSVKTNCFTELREAINKESEETTLDPVFARSQRDWSRLANEVVGNER